MCAFTFSYHKDMNTHNMQYNNSLTINTTFESLEVSIFVVNTGEVLVHYIKKVLMFLCAPLVRVVVIAATKGMQSGCLIVVL